MIPVGNGWFRVTVGGTFAATGSDAIECIVGLESFPNWIYTGNPALGLFAWGLRLEAGDEPTSYIATTSAPVTRGMDSAQFNDLSWYSPSAGTLFAEYVNLGSENRVSDSVFGLFATNDGTFSQNEIVLSDQGSANTSSVASGGSLVFAPGGALNAAGSVNKLALAYSAGGFSSSANGAMPVAGSGGLLPTAAAYSSIGSRPDGQMRSRYVRKIQYFGSRLSDAAVQGLTQ